MPRERHALEGQADAPPDLHVEHRQRDGDPGAPVDDLVQVRVARIVVVVRVAAKAQVVEQEFVQRDDAVFGRRIVRETRAQLLREALELADIAVDIQPWVGILRDLQTGPRQFDPSVVARYELARTLAS